MEEKIVKDGEVEVSSDEDGFKGAWFRGVLEDDPTKSLSTKLRVRYLTLLENDGLSPLIEHIEPRFIRPVPSEDRYIDLVLVKGSTVDANHNDGWWTGLVVRKLDDETFLVYFNSPPDIIQFHRNQLRPHLNWNGLDFYPLGIQEVDTSTFSSGSRVEVTETEVAWYPAIIVKEIELHGEKQFIVKSNDLTSDCEDTTPNRKLDSCRVRPVPPPFSVEQEYSLVDCVEAFRDLGCPKGWHRGSVKGVLDNNRYLVYLEATKEELEFHHSELRPCKVWENGAWHDGTVPKPVKKTPSNIIKMKPLRSRFGAKPRAPRKATYRTRKFRNLEDNGETISTAETSAATGGLRKKRSADVDMNDNTPPVIIQQIGEESVTPVTQSPVTSASPLKRTKSDTQGKTSPKKTLEPMRNKNDLENDSIQHKISEEDKSKKRKREEKEESDPKETDGACDGSNAEINDTSNNICNDDDVDGLPLSACISISPNELSLDRSLIVVNNAAAAATDVEETQEKDTLMVLPPFAKKLPLWKSYETHEEVEDLQLDASSSKLSSLSCYFDELEKNGFDVATPRSRINKIMSLQDGKAKKEEEIKCVEKKIEAEEMEMHRFEEEVVELNRKMLELKRQELVAKEKREEAEKRMVEMKSYAETIHQEIEELELEFKTTP